jgi:alpha-glucoside transport system substrate-binding protein
MITSMKRRAASASLIAFGLVAAACGSDSKVATTEAAKAPDTKAPAVTTADTKAPAPAETDAPTTDAPAPATEPPAPILTIDSGKINIWGPETGNEADGFTSAFKTTFKGGEVAYSGSRDFETQVRTAAEGGGLPDIAIVPQPGLAKDLADKIPGVPAELVATVNENFDPFWTQLVTKDDKVLGVPNKSDLKSLVWYSPKAFADKGYAIPKTMEELATLSDKIKADGAAPWCIGIESGDATGWTFTDWMEDVMLRLEGPDVYDQWVNHEIPFNDPRVKNVADYVGNIWFGEGNVAGGRDSIVTTSFADAGKGLFDGTCLMHRQANFYSAQLKTAKPDVTFGPEGDVNVFYLPTIAGKTFGNVTLVAGTYAVAFNDKPETLAALAFLASPEYADARIKADKGGFLSANKKHNTKGYSSALDQQLAGILVQASPVRFDASDLMPSAVGAGSFWKEGTNFVAGVSSVDEFLDAVENSWPSA